MDCGGSRLCEHGRRADRCKECGGGAQKKNAKKDVQAGEKMVKKSSSGSRSQQKQQQSVTARKGEAKASAGPPPERPRASSPCPAPAPSPSDSKAQPAQESSEVLHPVAADGEWILPKTK
uniref:Uncharacterized protein n=1 Tax=Chromera velia CCMP2878 TaxID=1169474 RepID=A0A0G4HWL2_9ALVE|eukprot:Cvel_32664.t1-p1 / transcript=Cvel_32664.t1 / gene=Cvel_32664 / organism=Chromera_velia_CCMP2878 / gene_product=hypothetical protein / transcript_product=hypothetical protein / location=Cvel_scaffold5131:3469-3825(-) / protein_length=119 / sequence_SO=supercontig / SO=protein_coding / is_pseudo=false